MTGYRFELTCPICAGPVVHVNGANPDGALAHAVAACETCRKEYHVRVELMLLGSHR